MTTKPRKPQRKPITFRFPVDLIEELDALRGTQPRTAKFIQYVRQGLARDRRQSPRSP